MHEVVSAEPNSNFIESIGKSLGSALAGIGEGSSKIIKSFGEAIHSSLDGVGDLDKAIQ